MLPKKKIFLLMTIVLLGCIFSPGYLAGQESTAKYSEVKVFLASDLDLLRLSELGIIFDHVHREKNYLHTVLSEHEVALLRKAGWPHDVLVEDLAAAYRARQNLPPAEKKTLERQMREQFNIDGFGFGSMGGYYTFDEVVAKLDSMHLNYPELISEKVSLGLSVEGRDIWMVKISDSPQVDEGEPEILYTALHHAREPQGMATVIYFMYYLLENYGSNPDATFLVNNREMYFVPVVNPDGYVYNQQTDPNGGGFWRKNRKNNGDGSYGIDLNRNYGYQWGYNNSGSSPSPSSDTYRGPFAFSEPETQILRDFSDSRHFKLCFNYHTYSDLLIYPFGYESSLYPPAPDDDIFLTLAQDMTQFNNYTYGTANQTVGYLVNGEANDWMYGEQNSKDKIFAFTPEVGDFSDGFWPDIDRIFPLAEENVYPNIRLAYGEGVILADSLDPLPPSDINVYSDYTTPDDIILSWSDPTSLSNGDPLSSSDFVIEIERDGQALVSVNGGVSQYLDSGLNDGQEYTYSFYSRVIATDSTSEVSTAKWIAGGSPVPASPENLACTATSSSAQLTWNDPTTQDDGTPLDDLAHINIYRNGVLLASVAPGTEAYTDTPPQGFTYRYQVSAVDNEDSVNESALSNVAECFVGDTPRFLVWVGPDAEGISVDSGDSLFTALINNGESAFLTNDLFEFGNDLSIYQGIFVVLGIFSDNHVIDNDDPEGPALQDYLQNGGRLYLEGGDCFNYDPENGGYNIRPWFSLDDGADGSSDLDGIVGLNGLSSFAFSYAGDNSWMDELEPLSSLPIWQNDSNSDISGVFYDGFGSGRAIGIVPSFGGLLDAPLATKRPYTTLHAGEVPGSQVTQAVKERPRKKREAVFVKKAAWYPERKQQRRPAGELYNVRKNGSIEIFANTKADLLLAYLDMLGYTPEPQVSVNTVTVSQSLPADSSANQTFTISNPGSANAPALIFGIAENPLADWLTVSPQSGTLAGGESTEIILDFDAANLASGTHSLMLDISTNVSAMPMVQVAVALTVEGFALLGVHADTLRFDSVMVSQQTELPLMLYNQGAETLIISDIFSTDNAFAANIEQLEIAADDSAAVMVAFAPASLGSYAAQLRIVSNHRDSDTSSVTLIGEGISLTGIANNGMPASFAISANYPNPFNPSTNIDYQLPGPAEVQLTVYNVLGQRVRTLINGHRLPGYYQVKWDGRDHNGAKVGSGIYIYEFTARATDLSAGAADFRQVQKMILLK